MCLRDNILATIDCAGEPYHDALAIYRQRKFSFFSGLRGMLFLSVPVSSCER